MAGPVFVIDTHHHVGSLEALGLSIGTEGMAAEEVAEVEFDARIETLDNTGVDQAIVIPGQGYLRPDGMADTRRVNDGMAAYRDRRPDRFPAAVGVVEPLYGDRGLEELDRIHDELGLVGVSFHTRFQGVATNSPLVVRLVRRMAELGLVPFVHAVAEVADEALWKVQDLARAIPDTTVIVLDGFSSFERAEEVLPVARATPNLVFDTSLSHSAYGLERYIREIGADRLVFGTDVYSHVRPHQHNETLARVLAMDLDDGARTAILSGNLRRILGLPAAPAAAPAAAPVTAPAATSAPAG
jgi:predicted TIM-barrel fold metal-dependent hydrolase